MRDLVESQKYRLLLKRVAEEKFSWDFFSNKTILITGAYGLIGSFLVDLLYYRNTHYNNNINIIALGRDKEKMEKRFSSYLNQKYFSYLIQDISEEIENTYSIDYIVHAASGANPIVYKNDPVGVIKANINGMYSILKYAQKNFVKKIYYVSSMEIYGEQINYGKKLTEDNTGMVNINSIRSCYSESKRAAENLCICHAYQYKINISIGRFCHVYGPTMTQSDSRAVSQFLKSALLKENIILKSKGGKRRSYCFVSDAVMAILYQLKYDSQYISFNISNPNSMVTVEELADTIARINQIDVIHDISQQEQAPNNLEMATERIEELGWRPKVNLKEGIKETIRILEELKNEN